jgi:hypothetical protein
VVKFRWQCLIGDEDLHAARSSLNDSGSDRTWTYRSGDTVFRAAHTLALAHPGDAAARLHVTVS